MLIGEFIPRIARFRQFRSHRKCGAVKSIQHLPPVAGRLRHVDARLLILPAVIHVDEMDARQPRLLRHAVRNCQRPLRAFARSQCFAVFRRLRNEITVQIRQQPDDHHGFAVDRVVFRRLQIIVQPELRHADLVRRRMGPRLVVVGPHDVPLQVLPVTCLVIAFHPMVQPLDAIVPIPIDAEARNAVLHRPFDLPVNDFRIPFVIPAQQRLDVRKRLFHLVPFRHLLRARIIERRHFNRPFHRLRFRHISVVRHLSCSFWLDFSRLSIYY